MGGWWVLLVLVQVVVVVVAVGVVGVGVGVGGGGGVAAACSSSSSSTTSGSSSSYISCTFMAKTASGKRGLIRHTDFHNISLDVWYPKFITHKSWSLSLSQHSGSEIDSRYIYTQKNTCNYIYNDVYDVYIVCSIDYLDFEYILYIFIHFIYSIHYHCNGCGIRPNPNRVRAYIQYIQYT